MKFYKNNQRYTAINSNNDFIELKTLKTCVSYTAGNNEFIVKAAIENDVEISEEEFADYMGLLTESLSAKSEQLLLADK